jgi:hypothetical protein|nr:MAG TPA: hypothetical protein [Caudoviricetes sp.]
MGTISDKLMRIISTKEDIRQALISKGYDVPTSIPFKEYAKMILDLPCKADSFPDIEGIVARYSASGLTNEQMAANPVWVDKTGNGHDLQLKNFSWKGMSGIGGYVADIDEWGTNSTAAYFERNSIKITATFKENASLGLLYHNIKLRQSCVLKVTGIPEGCDAFLDDRLGNRFYMSEDGVYEIIPSNFLAEALYLSIEKYPERWYGSKLTIEQLPLYPGALVFDGVDDYGTCDNFPILTKEKGYTVVALRQWITRGEIAQGLVSNVKNWLKDGAFLLEYRNIQAEHLNKPISFGAIGSENDLPHILTYQTSKSYNGVSITTGNFEGTDVLHVGKLAPTNVGTCINAAIWELVFLDHDATEEELTKIKDYFVKTYPWLFPDQAWTVVGKTNEDEDRATIANITGNGNDLVLSNFAFSGNSGYGEYAYNFSDTSWISIPDYGVISDKTSKSFNIKSFVLADYPVLYTAVNKDSSIKKVKIKVTNSIPGFYFGNKPANQIIDLSTDGIYEIPSYNSPNDVTQYGFRCSNVNDSCNITIEQIPEYEGYLVTDGVDDKITSSAFEMGKDFTVVGEWRFIIDERKVAGLIKPPSFYLFNENNGLKLFINNTEKSSSLNTKSLKAICSDGRVYFDDWSEMLLSEEQPITSSSKDLSIGYNSTIYTQMAFKNLGIYNDQLLSKDDCIKAYNYLQTLKAK